MKVLVVDDDVVSRMMLMHLVDSCGQYDISEAEDGEHAWRELAAGLGPALVFCDLRMPNLDGMELLRRLRADPVLGATPFVLVSAAADDGTLAQARLMGADGYIVKPFAVEQVRAELARLARPGPEPDERRRSVAARLDITPDRLLLYLTSLQRQLEQAGTVLGDALAPQRRARLLDLAEACTTLGLRRGAARLRAAADSAEAGLIQGALLEALEAVRRQQGPAQE